MGVEWAVQSDDVSFDHQHPSTFGVGLWVLYANMLSTFGSHLLNTQHQLLGAPVSIFARTLTRIVHVLGLRQSTGGWVPRLSPLISCGMYHGKGKYSSKDGDEYDGEWVADKPHGQGRYATTHHTTTQNSPVQR